MLEYLMRRDAGNAVSQPEPAKASKAIQERPQEFPRHDVPTDYRPLEPAENVGADANSLLLGVVGASVSEIESLIRQLEQLRDFMSQKSHYIQREVEDYGRLSDEVTASIKIIAEGVSHLNEANIAESHSV
jgi:hypothetical protein